MEKYTFSPSFYNPTYSTYSISRFLRRENRFVALVKQQEKILRCHLPNPGRLKELLIPKAEVLLRFPEKPKKTDAAIIGVKSSNSIWVSLDTQLPNRFIKANWTKLPILSDYSIFKSEFQYKNSRFDFRFQNSKEICFVEVKSVSLVDPPGSGISKFPDAPTKRGTRHVQELILAKEENYRAIVLFVVPRRDSTVVMPNKDTDPVFAKTVKQAKATGVEFYAFVCPFSPEGIIFKTQVPVSI